MCAAAEEGKPGASQPELPADAGAHTIERLDKFRNSKGSLSVAQIRSQLQRTMQADAAVFRTQVRPLIAFNQISEAYACQVETPHTWMSSLSWCCGCVAL